MENIVLAELTGVAKLLATSGYFDAKGTAEQAVAQLATKILAGREMGLGPFAAVQGIHVIQGRPALSANLIASAIKSSPKYDYRVRQLTHDVCEIEFFERGGGKLEPLGVSTFTAADARAAGTQNMAKFARNMLFARAISNGARWYCPDLFAGSAVYVPEELGALVDGEGNVVNSSAESMDVPADVPAEVMKWQTPADAFEWSVGIGAVPDVDTARALLKRLVDEQWQGRLTPKNRVKVMASFHAMCMENVDLSNVMDEEEMAH
jgi:hypothetical protein